MGIKYQNPLIFKSVSFFLDQTLVHTKAAQGAQGAQAARGAWDAQVD